MARKIDWERQIGRRLRLRDLHVLSMVVEHGSMAKAAAQLGVSQPAVSEVITDLEHALGVTLLDRSSRGVEATIYASALLKRSRVAFDELKQGIRDVEFLAVGAVGELRIGCPESISSSILPPVIQRMHDQYPGVVPNVDVGPTDPMLDHLLRRELDLVIARGGPTVALQGSTEELNAERLFDDDIVVAASAHSKWARRRKVDLAELMNEQWILSAPGTWNHSVAADAFSARGLDLPHVSLTTLSIHLRANLVVTGRFITVFPKSVLRLYGDRFSLNALRVDLPRRAWPVTIITLKKRTLSPIVERFIVCAREVARSFISAS